MSLEQFKADVRQHGPSEVARRLSISPASASLLARDRYPGNPAKMHRRITRYYSNQACPHTGESVQLQWCETWQQRPVPTSDPADLRQWQACQQCLEKEVAA